MNLGVISRNVGIALISCAVFMFLSALVAALDGFDSSFSPLFPADRLVPLLHLLDAALCALGRRILAGQRLV